MIPDTSGNDLRPADLWGSFLDPTLTGRRGTSGNLPCHLAHFFVNEAVRCKNDRRAQLVWCSFEVADLAASFFNEQNARGDVPLVEAEFPEAVEAPGGHAGQIERRRSVAAHAVGSLSELAVILKIRAASAVPHGKAGAEQACREGGDLGDDDLDRKSACRERVSKSEGGGA